jgi:hypothetical protein
VTDTVRHAAAVMAHTAAAQAAMQAAVTAAQVVAGAAGLAGAAVAATVSKGQQLRTQATAAAVPAWHLSTAGLQPVRASGRRFAAAGDSQQVWLYNAVRDSLYTGLSSQHDSENLSESVSLTRGHSSLMGWLAQDTTQTVLWTSEEPAHVLSSVLAMFDSPDAKPSGGVFDSCSWYNRYACAEHSCGVQEQLMDVLSVTSTRLLDKNL